MCVYIALSFHMYRKYREAAECKQTFLHLAQIRRCSQCTVLTPTLICCSPDLLLFCHSDMFNKYCQPATGYTRGVVVSLQKVMD